MGTHTYIHQNPRSPKMYLIMEAVSEDDPWAGVIQPDMMLLCHGRKQAPGRPDDPDISLRVLNLVGKKNLYGKPVADVDVIMPASALAAYLEQGVAVQFPTEAALDLLDSIAEMNVSVDEIIEILHSEYEAELQSWRSGHGAAAQPQSQVSGFEPGIC